MLARFIHAADLHLDTPFAGLAGLDPAIADVVAEATFTAWERIVELCIAREVDGLLIAGDVYNNLDRSVRAQLRYIDGLERLSAAGIRVFFCHGNHDPLDGWEASYELPPGVTRFPAEVATGWLDAERQVAVVGASYPTAVVTENLAARFQRPSGARFSIGLLHCNVGGMAEHGNYAPASVATLSESGFDYWALGHVHTRQVLQAHNPAIVYPGNPQGLQINETGPRGVYLVEVGDDLRPRLEFLPVSPICWGHIEVGIDGLEGFGALRRRAEGELERRRQALDQSSLLYRLRISGAGGLHSELARPGVADDLRGDLNRRYGAERPFAWCESVRLATRPAVDRDAHRGGDHLAGVLLAIADEHRADPGQLAQLRASLDDFYLHPDVRPYWQQMQLGEVELLEMLTQAETLLLSRLEDP